MFNASLRRALALWIWLGALTAASGICWAADPPALSADDARIVYQELLATHDGHVRNLVILRFLTEDAANAAWKNINERQNRHRSLDKLYKNAAPRELALFMLPPALRARVINLQDGEKTPPVATPQGWYIAELFGVRRVPAPDLATVEARLPGWITVGALPSPHALQTDAALIERSVLNAIETPEQVRALPLNINVDAPLSSHFTALMRAIDRNRAIVVAALLERGAAPGLCTHRMCPLHLALARKSPEIVELLLQAKADPNQRDPRIGVHQGPLIIAARQGNLDLSKRLLAAGADPNGQSEGAPPLLEAARAGQRDMIELLVAHKADLLRRSAAGFSALDSARDFGNAEFTHWVQTRMEVAITASGRYAWEGWVEQGNVRQPIGEQKIVLARAPFRIILKMKPGTQIYVAAANDPAILADFAVENTGSWLNSYGSVGAEGDAGKDLWINTIKESGTTHSWWANDQGSRFARVVSSPAGVEHIREISEFVLFAASGKTTTVAVDAYPGREITLIIGASVPWSYYSGHVFAPRRFTVSFR